MKYNIFGMAQFPVLRMIIGITAGILALLVILYLLQDKLIFFPQRLSENDAYKISRRFPTAEDVNIKTPDNLILKGWLVKTQTASASPLIIYFGGNAEELSYLIPEAQRFNGWSLALINYRGYGLNMGRPSEKSLFSDAISIYDYAVKRKDIDSRRVVVMGRSLGTGVAVYLAAVRPVTAVILVSPFDSLVNVAKDHYPFLPVSLMLRHRFDSISRVPDISVPLLALAASEDTIIRSWHSQRLVEKWGGRSSYLLIEGADHITISAYDKYWKSIRDFLGSF